MATGCLLLIIVKGMQTTLWKQKQSNEAIRTNAVMPTGKEPGNKYLLVITNWFAITTYWFVGHDT